MKKINRNVLSDFFITKSLLILTAIPPIPVKNTWIKGDKTVYGLLVENQ
jgi:hypothetical protein